MSFECGDCYTGIQALLMNRPVTPVVMNEALRKAVLELTNNYKHPLLEATGPVVSFTPFVNNYQPNFFLNPADDGLDVMSINSFFIYNNPFIASSSSNGLTNSGYDLKFRSIDTLEVLLNIPGIPQYWTRQNNTLFFGSMPDNSYNTYARYQKQHPNSNEPNGFLTATQIMMADEWQETLEYAAALRVAPQVNLSNKRTELREALYGDTKFQATAGVSGSPGLIFGLTDQRNRDQATTTRRMRLRMGRV
jgi:hypothetical protein